MRGSADSLILQTSNARTMKMRKSDLWLAFCAHQISWNLWSKMKPCFSLGFCASWNCEFQWFQKSACRWGLPKKIDNHWKSIDGSKNFNVASSSRRMLFMRCNEDPWILIRKSTNELSPVTVLLIKGLISTYRNKLYESFAEWNCAAAQRQNNFFENLSQQRASTKEFSENPKIDLYDDSWRAIFRPSNR